MNENINPDASEVPYNGIDDDCNTATFDDDLDQDNFVLADDCDDTNANINPDALEVPYNSLDDDCNAATFDDDLDQDSFLIADDCDDTNASINPDAQEIPNNGIDEDCDGMDLTTSVHTLAQSTINIYPNPAIDFINVAIDGSLNFSATVYNLKGQLLINVRNLSKIQIESLANGAYILEIKDLATGKRVIERIVKW